MLQCKNLSVIIEWKEVLSDVSLWFELGKNYCLLGKNGSWKSSLALTLMWHPKYTLQQGDILLDGKSIQDMPSDERAKAWIFLAFQTIPEIKGIKLFEFLRTIYSAKVGKQETFLSFKKIVEPLLQELHIEKDFLWRDLNVGFSGWERRKIEILQIKLLQPRYIILDEVDSGLDVDAFRAVAMLMQQLNSKDNSFIIITHYFSILDYIPVDRVYVLEKGKLVTQGDKSIADKIKSAGFGG
jgi:Fe-S cluster assembly ATP-binding protein